MPQTLCGAGNEIQANRSGDPRRWSCDAKKECLWPRQRWILDEERLQLDVKDGERREQQDGGGVDQSGPAAARAPAIILAAPHSSTAYVLNDEAAPEKREHLVSGWYSAIGARLIVNTCSRSPVAAAVDDRSASSFYPTLHRLLNRSSRSHTRQGRTT